MRGRAIACGFARSRTERSECGVSSTAFRCEGVSDEKLPRRVESDDSRPAIAIPAAVLHEVRRHALETNPEECCGLVTGTREDFYRTVSRCTNVMTRMHLNNPEAFPRDAMQAYYMNEIEYLRAQEEAESRGEFVSAVYHSHVDAGAYLSEDDIRFAEHVLFPFPDAAQIVLGVWDRAVQAQAVFIRDRDSGEFVGHPVAIEK
jgi:proteasome lid subunit RPN8/RPN11